MVKILPFERKYSTNYSYSLNFVDPESSKNLYYEVYSYIDDPSVIYNIIASATKYPFAIKANGEVSNPSYGAMSINQAVSFFRRLRFYKTTIVERQKVVKWNEVIEEEL